MRDLVCSSVSTSCSISCVLANARSSTTLSVVDEESDYSASFKAHDNSTASSEVGFLMQNPFFLGKY